MAKKYYAFYDAPPGTVAPDLSSDKVYFVEATDSQSGTEILNILKSNPTLVTKVTDLDDSRLSFLTSLTLSQYRPASLYRIGISRSKNSHETRLWFDNRGGAAAIKWTVLTSTGAAIPGLKFNPLTPIVAGQTDFLPFSDYQSSARLSPVVSGVGGLLEGVLYLVYVEITTDNGVDKYLQTFLVPTADTGNPIPTLTLAPLPDNTTPDTNPVVDYTQSGSSETYEGIFVSEQGMSTFYDRLNLSMPTYQATGSKLLNSANPSASPGGKLLYSVNSAKFITATEFSNYLFLPGIPYVVILIEVASSGVEVYNYIQNSISRGFSPASQRFIIL